MKLRFFLLAFVALVFSACQEEETAVPDYALLLVNRDWESTGLSAHAENGQTMDYYGSLDECDKDDIWRFVANGYYEVSEGELKCAEEDPQIYETGSWELTGDQLTLRQPSGPKTFTVQEVTSTTLRLQSVREIDGRNVFFNYTFSR